LETLVGDVLRYRSDEVTRRDWLLTGFGPPPAAASSGLPEFPIQTAGRTGNSGKQESAAAGDLHLLESAQAAGSLAAAATCRYPAECDLRRELDQLNAKMDTLIQLLSGRLVLSGERRKEKAG